MALTVVGGIYLERCTFPADEIIFGSGGRAAATLKSLDPAVSLVSFVGADAKHAIDHEAENSWDVPLTQYPVAETVSFEYYHGLSKPTIRPMELPDQSADTIAVTADAILQFGMLEGDAKVAGDSVVYDPQNPQSPRPFSANGSAAKHLAYVLNGQEARLLSGQSTTDAAAKRIMELDGAEVVVVKSGASGSKLYVGDKKTIIPAFETDRVWPIGSGDVFAAVFAHYWTTARDRAEQAATYASRAAALYCSTRQVPVLPDLLTADKFRFPELRLRRAPSDVSIYLAGPFFTMGQLWLVEEARRALRDVGFNVFSPFHDVGVGDANQVVPEDIRAIENADVLLALCDGLDPGTLFEVGYAVKKGIPVVAFAEQTTDEAMKMLLGTGCTVCRDFTSSIYHAKWKALQ